MLQSIHSKPTAHVEMERTEQKTSFTVSHYDIHFTMEEAHSLSHSIGNPTSLFNIVILSNKDDPLPIKETKLRTYLLRLFFLQLTTFAIAQPPSRRPDTAG